MRRARESPEKVMKNSWESHKKVMRKSWESNEKVLRKSWGSHKKVMRKSWDSHEKVIYSTLQTCLFLSIHLDTEGMRSWMGGSKTMAAFQAKTMVKRGWWVSQILILLTKGEEGSAICWQPVTKGEGGQIIADNRWQRGERGSKPPKYGWNNLWIVSLQGVSQI